MLFCQIVYSDIVTYMLKIMMGDTECLILLFGVPAMFQLKLWSARRASHHPVIRTTIIHRFFSLIHPVDEFSFKEIRM